MASTTIAASSSTISKFIPRRSPITPVSCAPAAPKIPKATTASTACSPSRKIMARRCGPRLVDGVDTGEDWAVIADRAGLFIFDGGEPVKISQEIQPLWDTINWQYGYTLWVRVDTRAKRILVGVPLAPATQPNRVLVLDYRSLSTAADIATYASVHTSSMTGRMIS